MKGLEIVAGALGGGLEERPKEVDPVVAKGKAKDGAGRLGVKERSPLTGEVRQHEQPPAMICA